MRIDARVRMRHIRDGSKGNCRRCPVFLALREALESLEGRPIDPALLESTDIDGARIGGWLVPWPEDARGNTRDSAVQEFMDRFDYTTNRESMRGLRFTLDTSRAAPRYPFPPTPRPEGL
jgi:hypothetical protein